MSSPLNIPSPQPVAQRLAKLRWQDEHNRQRLRELESEAATIDHYLEVADKTTAALEILSQKLFEQVLGVLEKNLTRAVQEVLGQPIQFKSNADFKRGSAAVSFAIDRDGNAEDVLKGQGGSVQNVLSVGLRMFALATLDEQKHRRFLVLDEQDCWLRPELVPRLVNIVHRAAKELDFQVLMISHHDLKLFEKYADRVYRLSPKQNTVHVEQLLADPEDPDGDD